MPNSEPLARAYARFTANLTPDHLPPPVTDKLKASLLHALTVSLIGAQTPHGQAAIQLTKAEEPNPNGATILADGARASRSAAAFANSKLMHATNQTDSYRMLIHPGPCVIPAALATAQLTGANGPQLLTALAAGYEVQARIAGDFIPATQARGFRCSPIYGTLGAAIATAKLLNLTETQTVTALALAATFAAGTTEGPRTGGREMLYHEPQATRSGITAALLARENLPASETCLEGEAGFYNAFTGNNQGQLSHTFSFNPPGDGGPGQTDLAKTIQNLGHHWELMRVTPKIYPTAGYNCPVIELATRMRAAHDIPPQNIEKITIEMNWLETTYPSPAFPNPHRAIPGVGSTHYFAAYTWAHRQYPPLRQRLDPGIDPQDPAPDPNDPNPQETANQVANLMQRIQIIGNRQHPHFAPRITIRDQNGAEYTDQLTGNELEWDFPTLTARLTPLFPQINWPTPKLNALTQAVATLETAPNLTPLINPCTPG